MTATDAIWSMGRDAWPGVVLETGPLAAWLSERGLDQQAPAPELAADWYIACAALRSEPRAVAALLAAMAPVIDEALRRVVSSPAQVDEVRQRLWIDLLTAAPGHGLGSWKGQGRLSAFVRVSAVRLALKLRRADQREVLSEDDLLAQQASELTPELSFLKESYRAVFRESFQRALDSLSSRDQLLLRQHTLDGLGIDQLAAQHHVHRATAARWLAAARETLVLRARRHFFAAVELPPDEGEGVLRLVESRLDETIRRRLQGAG